VRDFYSWQEGRSAGIAALLPGLSAAAKGEKIQPGAYLELISDSQGANKFTNHKGEDMDEKS